VNSRITPEFFSDDSYRRIYEYLLTHWGKYAMAPDEAVVKGAFPNFEPQDDPQPTEYFIDELRRRRKKQIAYAGMNTAVGLYKAEDDPDHIDKLLAVMHEAVVQARLETAVFEDEDLTLTGNEYLRLIEERMEDPGYLRGISTGYRGIDLVTGGLQPEQFVVLIGTPKSFKSATLLSVALNIHAQAKVPLFIGFEMSNIEQKDRAYSLLTGLSLTKVMRGSLSLRDQRLIEKAVHLLEGQRSLFFSTDISSATTVSGVQAKIQEYQPDAVLIDGAYLMQSEIPGVEPGSPQALTSISRGLKRLAQSMKLPIMITTQASLVRSKGGLSLGSAMYTQAWGQDADIFMGVERESIEGKEDDSGPAIVKFRVIESRSGPRKDTYLEWDWNHGSVQEIEPSVREALQQQQGRVRPGY
jgi:replicative DNA helicase